MKKIITLMMLIVTVVGAFVPIVPVLADEIGKRTYTMIDGRSITIKDSDIVDATDGSKGDRAALDLDSKERTLIINGKTLLMPLVDGKWNEMNNYLFDSDTETLKANQKPTVGASINAVTPDHLQTSNGWSWQSGHQSGICVAGYNYQNSLKMYDNMCAAGFITKATVAVVSPGGLIGKILSVIGISNIDILGINAMNEEIAKLENAYDKTTDKGFGTVTTTKNGRFYDYFYNDSWGTPQSALSKPDGSDNRTPNNWPGELSAMHMDFYLGWSCDYNSAGRWVGVNGNKTAY